MKSKKIKIAIVYLCALVIFGVAVNTKKTEAKNDTYKLTKYKSFVQVKKAYLKKDRYKDFGLKKGSTTVKTKWGNKKAMIISRAGFTADITNTNIFVKHNNKIYCIAKYIGYTYSISKDRNYLYISGGGTYFMIYKYDKVSGRYKKLKYVFNDGQEEYDIQKETLAEEYGLSEGNIKYTFHK